MYVGIAMVAAGALLIGLLVHRSRKDRSRRGEHDGVPLPRNPGGTTYRSTGGSGAAPTPSGPGSPPVPPGRGAVPPAAPGQVYGASRPAQPRVYGGTPAARPSGGLYGARPANPGEQTQAMPPEATAVPPTAAPPDPAGPGVSPGRPDAPLAATGEDDEPRYGRGLPG